MKTMLMNKKWLEGQTQFIQIHLKYLKLVWFVIQKIIINLTQIYTVNAIDVNLCIIYVTFN